MISSVVVLCAISSGLLEGVEVPTGTPILRFEAKTDAVGIPSLSWDTEGGSRASVNLLYAPLAPSFRVNGEWASASELETETLESTDLKAEYRVYLNDRSSVVWRIAKTGGSAELDFEIYNPDSANLDAIRLVFPFDPRAAATTVLPADWSGENRMRLPVILSAPDFGQMLLSCPGETEAVGSLHGVREGEHKIDFHLE
jgi:hypothetical protein